MQCKLLTIAVPAYNMEKYLSRCLDSILLDGQQDYLEVILINDGSKDNTLAIAREYEKKYPDILTVVDKPNGGWGTAINKAIGLASGRYFKILDSDDWFDSKALVEFIELLKTIDVDLVATSFSYEYTSGGNKNDVYPEELCNRVIQFDDYLRNNNHDKHLPMATITFRTKLLQDNRIMVAEKYYADIDYNLTPLFFVKNIFFSQINLYRYWIGREGQSTSLAGYNAHIDDFLKMAQKVVAFYKKHSEECSIDVKTAIEKDLLNILRFSYYLLLSPQFAGKKQGSRKCREFDTSLKKESLYLYKRLNRVKVKKVIPYIFIWRKFGFNILNLRSWI